MATAFLPGGDCRDSSRDLEVMQLYRSACYRNTTLPRTVSFLLKRNPLSTRKQPGPPISSFLLRECLVHVIHLGQNIQLQKGDDPQPRTTRSPARERQELSSLKRPWQGSSQSLSVPQ
ncbi:hypothetical protein KIL84_017879 [Mauremys mutica]|uniref:Uncharacterized protein n=1 Tax=Mauremys mutica TaxID=74926 RepID=A0A9D3X7C8_9SAUR|nr:hypothetical protein KIL84_017879 [Mauremys mutica]